jgi:alanyl-tRNA synthetase
MISMYSDPLEPGISYWKCLDIKIMCGGTHVANTAEIGKVSLRRRSQGKNLDRIYLGLD